MSDDATPERPMLRIVRGTPDDIEVAALTAALVGAAAANAADATPQQRPLSVWADRSAALRRPATGTPLRPGAGAWRASALPR